MQREAYYDNARFLLITLVVFGHLLTPFVGESQIGSTLYRFIYTFHMPAFILLAGFFAKGFHKEGYLKKIFFKLLIPYFIFQIVYSLYYVLMNYKGSLTIDFFLPQWSLWFLLSLFFWNALLFVITKLQPKWALTVSLTISLLIGYVDFVGQYLSLSRTFVFLPIFLIGFYMKKEHFVWMKQPTVQIVSASILLTTLISFFYLPQFNTDWLLGSMSYEQLDVGVMGGLYRFGWYMLTLINMFSFLSLVPTKKFYFTDFGARTLYVYLLHGFIIQYARNEKVLHLENGFDLIILAALSIGLTIVLSSKLINAVAQPLIDLRVTKMKYYLSRVR
ncbi:acyltransferase family protein [Bacillus solimangrovi]|uniref:Acyltransferase n=1 Tax=Bacillus solimangrovi TaxID=1305675 RepID=A0A1E5LGP9_9BACI|nr:acyltransferase [Bacillus solimangrovi]